MTNLTIKGLADAGGVGVETIRFYQRKGLLPEPPRAGAIRRYGEGEVERLRFIRSAQSAGFTLAEIGELLDLDAVEDRSRARELALQRVAALDQRIEELKSARRSLARLAERCAGPEQGACPILTSFHSD